MLTGYTQEEIADISLKSFKMPVFAYPDSSQVTSIARGSFP